jgi:hypothetical protein
MVDYTVIDEAHRRARPPSTYPVVATLRNDSPRDMVVWLEMLPEQLILGPGQSVDLVARPDDGLLPLSMHWRRDGVTVFAATLADPDWHLRFNGHLIRPATPTRLVDFEGIVGDVCAMRGGREATPTD